MIHPSRPLLLAQYFTYDPDLITAIVVAVVLTIIVIVVTIVRSRSAKKNQQMTDHNDTPDKS